MPIPQSKTDNYPKTAKERIYSTVKEWIIDGTLSPGEKIYDKEVAEYFSVSRTPVREAFQMLEEQRLIVVSPGKESRVSEIDFDIVTQSYEMLAIMESLAVRYAMPRFSSDVFSALKNTVEQFKDAVRKGDSCDIHEADHLFHQLILEQSGSVFLLQFCSILETYVARTERQFFSGKESEDYLRTSVQEHEMILKAIEDGDAGQAQEIMKDNWLNTIPFINQYLQEINTSRHSDS